MIHLTLVEAEDINQCVGELQNILGRLDAVGAGIAAIHVNAAIEQLGKNLQCVMVDEDNAGGEYLLVPENNG